MGEKTSAYLGMVLGGGMPVQNDGFKVVGREAALATLMEHGKCKLGIGKS